MAYDFDLFVIGAGSGGVRAARISAGLGASVAIAENLYLGGTCVNVGCVPKKIFVYGSEFSDQTKTASAFGWRNKEATFHWPTLRDNKTQEITRLNSIYLNLLKNAGVELVHGFASFVDNHTVEVDGKHYTAERILIATGGWPRKPTFKGAEYAINSNDVFSLDEFPRRVLVQGGGYIAVEFAGIFNGLGAETELVYRGDLFMRGFDQEIRAFTREQMENKGVQIHFNVDISEVSKNSDGSLRVCLNDGTEREVDAVFSAVGRDPKVEGLNLKAIGVELDSRGCIAVNDNFETNVKHIYAVGDVIGRVQLTPVALAEGMALARHWYSGDDLFVDYENIPTAIFCQPNIGTVGLSEEEAKVKGIEIDVYVSKFTPLKHTLSGSGEKVLMKLIVNTESDKVIGLQLAGADAGEILQGMAVAIKAGATKADFDATIGVHPTAAEEFVTMRSKREA